MDPLAVARSYFDAWNARDPARIAACFAPGGTYSDPIVSGLPGPAVGEYARTLFAAFPDLSFEIASIGALDGELIAAEWIMRGTNGGSFQGLPPTGARVSLPGADFIRVREHGVQAVTGYFDQRAVPEQLGLQVLVQPVAIGPFAFGTSTLVQAEDVEPGAISFTALEVRSDAEASEVRERTRAIVQDLLAMPGFVGFLAATVGRHMFTLTAWRDSEAVEQLRGSAAHKEATARFFGPDFARGGQTGVWVAERLNGMWVRCDACAEMAKAEGGVCACGADLPAAPPWL
jgi:steroid delta-isomerase-like uncharacterized protein